MLSQCYHVVKVCDIWLFETMKRCTIFSFLIAIFIFSACEKDPGPGGKASIQGKVWIEEYNGNCSDLRATYYGVDEEVYIIAGDEPSYFERVRTGPDGTYWFPYLQEGRYTVYAISNACDLTDANETRRLEVEISDRKAKIVLPDIVVVR